MSRTTTIGDIRKKFPGRTPIVVTTQLNLKKKKYLVPHYFTWSDFQMVLRKQLTPDLRPGEAIFMFVNNSLPLGSNLISGDAKALQDDQVLECEVAVESTFG
jgi:hypothetical protein